MDDIVCSNCRTVIGRTLKMIGATNIICSECLDFEERWHDHPIAKWYDNLTPSQYEAMISKINSHYCIRYDTLRSYRYGQTGYDYQYKVDTYYAITQLAERFGYDAEKLWSRRPSLADVNKLLRKEEKKTK